MNTTKWITLLYTSFLLMMCTSMFSQVAATGIGTETPNPSAVLDVVNDAAGILIPRMTSIQKNAIAAPAPGLLVYDMTLKCISQNSGTADAPLWVCLSAKDNRSNFIHMPALKVDTTNADAWASSSLDLYGVYQRKFSSPLVRSPYSSPSIPHFLDPTDLYYYILSYDDEVLEIKDIDTEGKLSFEILKTAPFGTYINVVFVVK